MSVGINECRFIGNLGKDPELRYTQAGSAVANLSVGVNEEWKDKQTGQKQSRTEWVRIIAFGRLAEIMGQYLTKGDQVYVSGRMQTRKWTDQNGQDRYTTEIVASQMKMLGVRQDGQQDANQPPQQQYRQTPQQQRSPQQQSYNQTPPPGEAAYNSQADYEDDIPF